MSFDANKGQNNSCTLNSKGDQYVECTECGATAEIGENAGKNRKYCFTFTCTAEKMIFEMRVRSIK